MGDINNKVICSSMESIDSFFSSRGEVIFPYELSDQLGDDWSKEGWIESCFDIEFFTRAIKNSMVREEDYDYKLFIDYH